MQRNVAQSLVQHFGAAVHDRQFGVADLNQHVIDAAGIERAHQVLYGADDVFAVAAETGAVAGVNHLRPQSRQRGGGRFEDNAGIFRQSFEDQFRLQPRVEPDPFNFKLLSDCLLPHVPSAINKKTGSL